MNKTKSVLHSTNLTPRFLLQSVTVIHTYVSLDLKKGCWQSDHWSGQALRVPGGSVSQNL